MHTGQQVGPYILEDALAGGAMGALHRARHTVTGDVVALKTVERTSRANLRGLRREIRALQTLEHPNVVRICDADINATPPWYAMELIDGLPLSKHWTVVPLERRWKTYASAFADMCDGLAFVHGLGLVHRDLKPQNVVLRTTHRTVGDAVVVDFGLATVSGGGIGREQLYKRSEVVGTPQYISPEQVSQKHVDPRTDLYALGCMLYEAVVGRPPFPADVPFVGMLKHVNEAPKIPQDAVDRTPPELIELIYAMLEKQPTDRPGYASDVRAVLARLADVGTNAHKPQPRTYLHRPEFVGRRVLYFDFERLASELTEGDGGVVVVRGPAGSGKSRVAIELMRRVQVDADQFLEVLLSQSPKSATSAPLASLRAAFEEVSDVCIERGERFARKILGSEGGLLIRHLPVLDGIPGVDEARPSVTNPDVLEQSTLEAITAVFERMADDRPVVLALDDVQWADPLTRRWLERVLVHQPWTRVPMMLILISRDDEAQDDLLDAYCQLEQSTVLEVGTLDDKSLAAMVESMTGVDEIPPEFFAALRVDAQGLPSRAAQWLAAAVGRNALVRMDGQWRFEGMPIEDADIHDTITATVSFEDLLAQRILSLEDAHRALIDLAAVLGPHLRPEVLAHLGESELDALDDLITDGVLVETGRGGVQFASTELHDVARGRLGDRPRTELHVRAAAILESVGAPVIEICHHLALSGWRDEARSRLFRAADEAFDAGEWVEAQRRYGAVAELGFKKLDREVVGWARIAILCWRHGDATQARAAIAKAEAAVTDEVDATALAELARARGLLLRSRDTRKSLESLEEAKSLFASVDEWLDERNVAVEIGNSHCRAGDFEKGRAVFTEIHDRARAHHDEEGVAIALASVGATWISSGKHGAAADFLSRAAAQFRDLDAPHRLADTLFNLGVCHVDTGELEAAVNAFREVVALRTEAGDQRGRAVAASALGHALLRTERPQEALGVLNDALEILHRSEDSFQRAVAHGYAGEAHAQLREFTEAMDHFVEALTIHRERQGSPMLAYVHVEIARLHRRLGLYEDARVHLDKAGKFAVQGDEYLTVLLRVQRGFLDLASANDSAVAPAALERTIQSLNLPPYSPAVVEVQQFQRALKARPAERIHGELRQHLPVAFR